MTVGAFPDILGARASLRHIDFTPVPSAGQGLMGIIPVSMLSVALLLVFGLVLFCRQSAGNAPLWLLARVTWLREDGSLACALLATQLRVTQIMREWEVRW